MAEQYLDSDVHGLFQLAVLVDAFWVAGGDLKLAAEIRLQGQLYGLTPIDRRRLQWEVARVEDVERKRQKPAAATPTPAQPKEDPREFLRAIS